MIMTAALEAPESSLFEPLIRPLTEAIAPPESLPCECWHRMLTITEWCPDCQVLFAPMSGLLLGGVIDRLDG